MEIFRDDIPTIFGADSNLRLRWFSPSQAAAAIEGPAAASPFGSHVEPQLVRRIVDELTTIGLSIPGTSPETPIEPAQLQMVCDTIWRERSDGDLTLESYLALGRPERDECAQQILDQRLVEEFEQLESERELDRLSGWCSQSSIRRGGQNGCASYRNLRTPSEPTTRRSVRCSCGSTNRGSSMLSSGDLRVRGARARLPRRATACRNPPEGCSDCVAATPPARGGSRLRRNRNAGPAG